MGKEEKGIKLSDLCSKGRGGGGGGAGGGVGGRVKKAEEPPKLPRAKGGNTYNSIHPFSLCF